MDSPPPSTGVEPVGASLELLARVTVELAEPLEVGAGPLGRRRVIGIVGGVVTGERLSGLVLPGGADWQLVTDDGLALIDTRYMMRTHDGALVVIATRGRRHGPAEVLDRLAAGERVGAHEYYFRVAVELETGDPRYVWLNRCVVVASAVREAASVIYDAYLVL